MSGTVYGAVEAGGTKFVCAVGRSPDDLRAEVRFPTTTPAETLERTVAWLREQGAAHGGLAGVGIACFGPVDPDPRSPRWGFITATPKAGWSDTDVAGAVGRALGVPVGFDTDVNGAGLGERRWGAARGLDDFVYVTVGTGIGGGGMAHGHLLHGLIHPEMGHMRVPHDRAADPFDGACPFHGDCLEGLASGPAMRARWGRPAEELTADHPAWALEADYLAQAVVNIACTLSPRRVIMGGGVMSQPELLPRVRSRVRELLNGYLQAPVLLDDLSGFLVAPALGSRAGLLGALALALDRLGVTDA